MKVCPLVYMGACYLSYVNHPPPESWPIGPQSFAAGLHNVLVAVSDSSLKHWAGPTAERNKLKWSFLTPLGSKPPNILLKLQAYLVKSKAVKDCWWWLMSQFLQWAQWGGFFVCCFVCIVLLFGSDLKKKSFKSNSAGFRLEFTKPMRQSESQLYRTQHIRISGDEYTSCKNSNFVKAPVA